MIVEHPEFSDTTWTKKFSTEVEYVCIYVGTTAHYIVETEIVLNYSFSLSLFEFVHCNIVRRIYATLR